ncbi:MAG TPA: hypothetical protein VEW45_05540 [Candidatus Dormibacteraeota bacterium]|nr:hypothetical protein [Candidatus Dormibacteraeota bacterium]
MDPFAPSPVKTVAVDVYTAAYRVSGQTATRFGRVADIVNQLSSTHMIVDQATVSEYAHPAGTMSAPQALVTLDEILFVVVDSEDEGSARPEMRIPKRPVRAQVALPPFQLAGVVHVPPGSRPVDGLLNAGDRFLPMTEVTVACAAHPELRRTATAAAMQRSLAHVIVVKDDERPEELLADVLDEQTAERWLKPGDSEEDSP